MEPKIVIATSIENTMESTWLTPHFLNLLTNGFNKIAMMSAKANGTRIPLKVKRTKTKSTNPKRITVLLI